MFKSNRDSSKPESNSKKSQAALEFLTTYAWAFIAISIAISALYYFGIFDFDEYLPSKCGFPSQFRCIDFSLRPGSIRIKLVNNLGEDIQVASLQVRDEAASPLSCISPPSFNWTHSTEKDIEFTSCSGAAYIPGTRADLKVTISYYALNTPSRPIHLVNGRINGKILSS